MNIHTAKTILVNDRLDWHKPHARWLSNTMYRLKRYRTSLSR
ncbi:hypothetical protein [Shimia marina]|uniref:Uncharacterized protein n=1 Tax=Shimia marina TaxID=321267 RepID=A0A0P1ERI0_9RHOB|nr:hypothetical protein [Shimia marina]CUH52869.1 hypothetical protein SHM7688_02316 [Shimia marina]SFD89222.1 hypothetical protein SAMN04488037_103120 [Shimia marina]